MAESSKRWLDLCLTDGRPDGILEVEEWGWSGHVLLVPLDYIRMKKLHDIPEANRVGVYILLGEKMNNPTVYIGVSTKRSIIERLSQHETKKDWWNEAILVTSKDNNLNAAHIEYLEARLCEIVKKAGKVNLDNTQDPSSNLSGKDKSYMEKFLDVLLIMLPILRGDMFPRQTLKKRKPGQLKGEEAITKNNITPDNYISENQKVDILSREGKKPPFTFSMVSIPIGSKLTFRKDENITAKVAGKGNEIEYKERVGSISTITQDILSEEFGKNWSSAQGARFWLYKGEILTKRRERFDSGKQNEFEKEPAPKSNKRDLRFTEILEAKVNGEVIKKPSWRNVVIYMVTLAGKNKHNLSRIREIFPRVQVRQGKRLGNFKYIPEIDCSIHDRDASNIANAIEYAANTLGFNVYIKFRWKETSKASRPGKIDYIKA